ncbi:MAG: 16S rRNA (cytidine(1402)-2'-O)-methyltransferase [Deltaproteobacteria bacterium]|nr:16S rRNA (cytidine(1402)-2'-O)-methyltransferase [Deltaproteobacteria bacterium]MBW2110688.1 16S rRNA (cytidine(1402)-2'-O)-methyltransferase [Deltaproteobacteria bacterium]MBW2351909.1 16S rRNA (cytidine(1402)-2'-O)-methyltransferase [Deltaproteobacteria bacterium]HDZ89122.1 16S rRNA (cytidine(1402)-2'-O)-methyltransferase [Deltaproteobacteria bacterium]
MNDHHAVHNPVSQLEVANPDERPGTLYVVSTPIGNLEDVTVRALKVLKSVEAIAAENVKRSRRLCERYQITTRIISYNQHNQNTRTGQLLARLRSGADLALVTDAGTPGISDPGDYLVRGAINEAIPVRPVPGPSAVVAALSVSGLPTARFVFLGFLSNKAGKRKSELKKLAEEPRTMVFFEAPHRIRAMLEDLGAILGQREMVLLREMTKVFEEALRGTPDQILQSLTPDKTRGEFTLVVAGHGPEKKSSGLSSEALKRIGDLIKKDEMSIRDIAELISRDEKVPYRQVYKACLNRKDGLEGLEEKELIRKLKVRNNLGLHARSAAKIVELGSRYRSRLFLKKDGEEVDGSSILSILTLACPRGTEMEARIVGEDSESFMEKLDELFKRKFGERV